MTTTTRTTRTTTTTRNRPSLMSRLRGRRHGTAHHHTTTTARAPAHHHKRHATLGDKISGALMKLQGSLTRRPGKKAAGTRRMHGTDGRGSHHRY
ncbi:hypothetical protein EV356DRAFT_532208 [Viridothelium virens]|uniref:Uncharacterized protein n=1 Tax=Viridothelium virens TaxID=1048519 RepID=A0A6A6HAN7_VIRVR|nr:hypothetical protein EV356DRAFT_532208 [Viridothelium virens]